MPIQHEIGYGEYTPQKLEHLKRFFEMHIGWTAGVVRRHPYWQAHYHYIDATAGCGYCPELDLPGSPLVFLQCVDGLIPYHADFIEREPGNCMQLMGAMPESKHEKVKIHLGDYRDELPRLTEKVGKNNFGLLFIDHSGDMTSLMERIPTLENFSICRPKMEILMYVPAANFKRVLYQTGTRLEDCLQGIRKRYWLVREPMGKHQWTFLMGSNTPPPEYRAKGFYRLDSAEGQEIFSTLNFTNKERDEWNSHTEPTPNTYSIPATVPSGQRPLFDLAEYASIAKNAR